MCISILVIQIRLVGVRKGRNLPARAGFGRQKGPRLRGRGPNLATDPAAGESVRNCPPTELFNNGAICRLAIEQLLLAEEDKRPPTLARADDCKRNHLLAGGSQPPRTLRITQTESTQHVFLRLPATQPGPRPRRVAGGIFCTCLRPRAVNAYS